MTEPDHVSESYQVPIATDDGESKKKGHARRFSDSALMAGGDDDASSSWAPPCSPGRTSFDNAFEPSSSSPPPRRYESEPLPYHTPLQQSQQAAPNSSTNKTLQDQVLAGTLGLLKMAGGATLSTTGKLIQPPLHVTQHLLLPALWSALIDYLNQVTPLRVKDWFRILTSSVHHIMTVIGNTAKGKIFQSKLHSVGDGIVDVVSSDASRQAIMDGMAAWVKLAEALHTPETKAFLEQLSVLGCRLVDAAASGRNKKLLHDVSDAVWAGLELMSDPSSTLAFAEVTAYLCFALEMEDALHREQPIPRQVAAQRRRQRNQYQRTTYVDPNMMHDANTTVEQVMLSSLGEQIDEGSLPSNVILNNTGEKGDWNEGGETGEQQDELNWRERAGDDIDLQLLQERITKRAEGLEEQRENRRRGKPDTIDTFLRAQEEQKQQQTQQQASSGTEQPDRQSTISRDSDIEEIIVTTVDENDDDDTEYVEDTQEATAASERESSKTPDDNDGDGLEYQKDKEAIAASSEKKEEDAVKDWLSDTEDQPPVDAFDGESAPNRFYRRLDEIMDKKRTEAVLNVLNQQLDGQASSGGLSWFPKAAAAAGAGNERGQDTIKNRVAAIRAGARSQIGVGRDVMDLAQDKEVRRTFSLFTIILGLIAMFWFAMGFYGCYAIVFGPIGGTQLLPSRSTSAHQQEIVVRIVREVVHVDADGKQVDSQQYPPIVAGEKVDQVAACVANAIE